MVKRLFAATESPDLIPYFHKNSIELSNDRFWQIPIVIENLSSAVAEKFSVSVIIENPESCKNIILKIFNDVSNLNPGKKIFSFTDNNNVIHRSAYIRVSLVIEPPLVVRHDIHYKGCVAMASVSQ